MRAAAWLLAACLASWPAPASAKYMDHFDLASLVHLSTHVVYADEVQHVVPPARTWEATTLYRVTRVLRGGLEVGATIEVWDDAYRLDPEMGPPLGREPRALLFLDAAGPDGKYRKVASGLRIFAGGKVYRFVQMSNPGPYEPVAQGLDPEDAWGRDPTGVLAASAPVDVPTFEKALAAAQQRAAVVEKALALSDRAARIRALVALLPPPMQLPAPIAVYGQNGTDALDREIVAALWATGDEGALRASLGRDIAVTDSVWRYTGAASGGVPSTKALRDIALDAAAPPHQRVGAVQALAASGQEDPKELASLLDRLLAAPDPGLRAAAVWEIGVKLRAAVTPALMAAARKERDEVVLLAVGKVLELPDSGGRFFTALPGERRAVATIWPLAATGAATRGALVVGYEVLAREGVGMRGLRLHLSRGSVQRHLDASENLYGSVASRIVRFKLVAPLAPGTYQASLELELLEGRRCFSVRTRAIPVVVK